MTEPKKPPPLPAPLDAGRLAGARGDSGVLSTRAPAPALRGGATAPAPALRSGAAEAPPAEGGFSAMLQHAGLWDLVQLRCESRVRCVVCVTSGPKVGFLYFNEGQIVHAVSGGVQGERAVLDVLGWTAGTWESCERPWPTMPTITISWQGLFLRAAQQQDEAKRQGVQAEPAPRQSQPQPVPPVRLASAPVPSATPTGLPAMAAAARRDESGVSYRPEDFEHAVRMDSRGAIVSGHGAAEDHAELAAYCCRLGDLLGELLAMGKLRAIDAGLRGGERCFVVREANGDTLVLRARAGVDLSAARTQLNL